MNTPHKATRLEFFLCLALIAFAILVWSGFIAHLQTTFSEKAAFHFMVNHLQLGESPEFILQIAGQGIPQPFDVLFSQREFWMSLVVLTLFVTGLGWLVARLWAMNRR